MSRGAAIEVQGAAQLRRTLKAAGNDLADFTAANAEVAAMVARAATGTAPRGPSGRLAGSIRGNKAKARATVLAGGASVRYANAIHWGTGPRAGLRGPHNIRPRPWLWQAAQDNEAKVTEFYLRRLEAIVGKVQGAPSV